MAPVPEVNTTSDLSLFQRLYEKGKRVVIDDCTYWLVEGDTLLDEDQLRAYADLQEARQQAAASGQAGDHPLVGIAIPGTNIEGVYHNNLLVRWAPDVELSYCVLKDTFVYGGEAAYELVVECMQQAAADWENACGVRFVYKPELDSSRELRPEGVLFPVREVSTGGRFIASAFFPNDPPDRRRVLIDPSFYPLNLRFNKTGVLRHELGHVLGFRHEHIRPGAPPACPDEDVYGAFSLTDYDPRSVMHYFCGDLGSTGLEITEIDKIGAQRLYGPPLKDFLFVR